MARMRRLLPLALAVLALAACEGGSTDGASPSPSPSPSASPTAATGSPTPSPSPSPVTRPIAPAWASPIERDLEPEELPEGALVPPGAILTGRIDLPAAGPVRDQVAVAYVVGEDPFASEHGLAVWQRFAEAPAWSVVYAFADPPDEGVLGIRLNSGDLTGDGHDELLVLEERGGTGACGTWTVVSADAEETSSIFTRETCDTEIAIVDGALEVREAVFEPDDTHCCPSAFRTTTLEWNGERFARTDVEVEPTT